MSSHRLHALSVLRVAAFIACAAIGFFILSNSAQAADTLSSSTYIDANGNGTIDNIKLTFDENIDLCTFEAGDWTTNTAGSVTVAITGINAANPESNGQGDCNGTDAVIYLSITADANETGGATAPVVSYANAVTAGSLSGTTTAQISAKANASVTDAAAPTVVSTTPASAATGVSVSADIVITFSEAMDTGFVESTEFTVSPDPGTFTAAWTVSNSVVTLSFPNMVCGIAYTVATVEAQVIAAAGTPTALITTGAQDGDWVFNASTCGGGGVTPAVITSFEYAGPVCTSTDTHSFSVTGTNIDAYIADDNTYFTYAEWVTNNIEGTGTIDVTYDSDATWAYLALQSDTGSITNTYAFELSDWSGACEEDEVVIEEEVDEEEVVTDVEDSVTPVAGVSPGDVIHSSSSTAVYYVTETYGRRVFINEATYFTWFDSFDEVMEVSAETMAALQLEGNMLPKAGVVLVKIQSLADVYYLDAGSDDLVPALRLISDEDMAISLFGSYWADYVIDIESTFFTKFESGSDVADDESLATDVSDMTKRVDLHE